MAAVVDHPGDFQSLPRFGLEQEMRIEGGALGLVSVSWVRVSSKGTLAVSQLVDYLVHLFDPSGVKTASVGGSADGPAEPPFWGGSGWIDDTLWVNDPTLGRIVLYGLEGERRRALPPLVGALPKAGEEDQYPSFLSVHPVAVYQGDTLLVMAETPLGDVHPEQYSARRHLLRISSDGRIQNRLFPVPESGDLLEVQRDGQSFRALVPFHPISLWTTAPDGARIALLTTEMSGLEGGLWRIRIFDPAGEELFSKAFSFQGIPIPESIVDGLVEGRVSRVQGNEFRSVISSEMRRRIPPVYPPVTAVSIGADYRIWVQLREAAEEYTWLVLSSQGEPQGRLALPRNAELQTSDHLGVWVTEVDEFGAPSVVRYRLVERGM